MNLLELSQISDSDRDDKWEDLFLTALVESDVFLLSQDPKTGPDGWPYLLVSTILEAVPQDSRSNPEPVQKIIQWLSERGIGLVINPQKEYPDFVLTFGMLWNFRKTGKFIDRVAMKAKPDSGKVDFAAKDLKQIGEPTEDYLPKSIRNILKQFFLDQGVLQPKICLISTDGKNFDLAFSLESLGNSPEKEWLGIGEALSWFLPMHYSVVLMSEASLNNFTNL